MKMKILTLTTLAALIAQPVIAQVCMEPDEMHAALVDWYQERPMGPRETLSDSKTQLWASPKHDTWTLVRYYSETSACVVAQGTDITSAPQSPQRMAELILTE